MTNRKQKNSPTIGTAMFTKMEDGLLNASAKRLAEYSHDRVSDEGIDLSNIHFEDLFELDDFQRIQDSFARATGVASIITNPDGIPITKPSNFTSLCINVIRQTEKGLKNCINSDAHIGRYNPEGAIVQPCLSGGLWDAGASISIGKRHIANWLIGQIRDQSKSDEQMLEYAEKIGADPEQFRLALMNIPVMPIERFKEISNTLFLIANIMSNAAYQNLRLARIVTRQKETERELLRYKKQLENRIKDRTRELAKESARSQALFQQAQIAICVIDENRKVVETNTSFASMLGYTIAEVLQLYPWNWDVVYPTREKLLERWPELPVDPMTFETRFRRKDGSTLDVEVTHNLAEFEDGKALFLVCRDITERRELQTALDDSEQRYREIFETSPDAIYLLEVLEDGKHFRNIDVNPAFEKMTGTLRADLIGKTMEETSSEEVAQVVNAKYCHCVEAGRIYDEEAELNLPIGRLTFQSTMIPIRDTGGRINRIIGITRDITERRRAETALRESEERYHRLVDLLPDGILLHCDGIINFANPTASEILGSERPDDLIGRRLMDFVPPDYQSLVTQRVRQISEEGLAVPMIEEKIRRVDGQIIDVEVVASPVEMGGKTTTLTVFRDITYRKQAEDALEKERTHLEERTAELDAALRETEGLFSTVQAILTSMHMTQICQSLMEHFIDLVKADCVTLYLVDHQRGEILLNLALGNSQDIPMTYQELNTGIAGWVFKSGQPILSLSAEDGLESPETYQRRIHDNVGSLIVVPLLTREGAGTLRVIGVVTVINRVGQRAFTQHDKDLLMMMATQAATAVENIRLYEEAQRVRDIANTANQSKSDFLTNMSHEIRTPMNAILGLTQLVLDTSLDDIQRNYLQKVQTSSRALLGILNDILDYSKIEAGKLNLEEVDFNLDETLRNIADLFSIGAEEKEIELVFEINPEVPLMLNGDPLRLGQVLNNLVGNAIKFTERGEIHVKVEVNKIEDGKTWLQFSVHDTGIGMTKEQIERLFHAFSQADTSTTRKFGGTGLGLTISKHLVEMMRGEIGVESVQGKGSVFHFTVPLQQARIDIPSRKIGELRGMKTLVVDDQDASLRVMDNLLNSWSFDVTLATSGTKGLAAVTKATKSGHPFELLLIDWKMPRMDGLEFARRVRDLGTQFGHPPLVIMVTAFGRESVLRSADAIQIDAVLDKPVIPSRLFDLLINLQKGRTSKLQKTSRVDNLKLFEMTQPIHESHILVVEDNETNQLVARGFLEEMGLVVDVASDGQEAIDKITSKDYDLILMDLQMPNMDGFEATQKIRSLECGHNLPIIAMTAAVMQKDKDASDAAGMNGHIAKPINVEELVNILMTWLPHHLDKAGDSPHTKDRPTQSNNTVLESTLDFDLNVTLNWLRGDQTLLKQILTSFQVDLVKASQEIRDASEQGNWTAVKGIVHKLKGTAGNMGAVALQYQAAELESELKNRPNADISVLEEKIGQALELCKHFLAKMADDHVEKTSASRGEVDKSLEELATFLLHNRLVPMKLLEKVQAAQTWGASGESLEKLKHGVDTFNYKDSLLALDLIRKELESKQ